MAVAHDVRTHLVYGGARCVLACCYLPTLVGKVGMQVDNGGRCSRAVFIGGPLAPIPSQRFPESSGGWLHNGASIAATPLTETEV